MAIRDQVRANAAHILQPGETVQAVFCAQTTSQYYALLSTLIIVLSDAYRVVVVTDKRILVCRSGRFRMTPVKHVIKELPRNTRIGPPRGLWWRCETLGEPIYVHMRFHKDVAAADAVVIG
jgi:Bacterial PH domain